LNKKKNTIKNVMRELEKIKRFLKKSPSGLEKKHFGRILLSANHSNGIRVRKTEERPHSQTEKELHARQPQTLNRDSRLQ
jgi:hypothetical protein